MTRSWHYAIARDQSKDGEDFFTIREVYVDSEDPAYLAYSQDPMSPFGETPRELLADLGRMNECTRRFMLDLTYDPPQLVALEGVGG
jgi:hypothetical protein